MNRQGASPVSGGVRHLGAMEMPLERDCAGRLGFQLARVAVAFVDRVHDQAGGECIAHAAD
jgi:hypothetical protein